MNLQKLSEINGLISINFCSQKRPQKLQNLTTSCRYLSQTKANSKKWWWWWWWWCSTQSSQSADC